MFKLLTLGIGFYLLYRLVLKPQGIGAGAQQMPLDDVDDGEYVDYEEVE